MIRAVTVRASSEPGSTDVLPARFLPLREGRADGSETRSWARGSWVRRCWQGQRVLLVLAIWWVVGSDIRVEDRVEGCIGAVVDFTDPDPIGVTAMLPVRARYRSPQVTRALYSPIEHYLVTDPQYVITARTCHPSLHITLHFESPKRVKRSKY